MMLLLIFPTSTTQIVAKTGEGVKYIIPFHFASGWAGCYDHGFGGIASGDVSDRRTPFENHAVNHSLTHYEGEDHSWQSRLASTASAALAATFCAPRWAIPRLILLPSTTSPAQQHWRTCSSTTRSWATCPTRSPPAK